MMSSLIYALKNFLIDLVSVIVYLSILIKKREDNDVRVLIYHSIGENDDSLPNKIKELNVNPQLFRLHMNYLKRNSCNIISIPEFYKCYVSERDFRKNTVAVTFDDGHENVFENAYPIMKQLSIPAALFITYEFVENGKNFLWMEYSELGKPLNWEQINLMKDYFNIFSHSLSHRNLRNLNDDDLKRECYDSKRLIAEKVDGSVDFFAYPRGSFGSFDSRVEKFLKEADYKLAFLNINGPVSKNDSSFNIKRTRIINRDNLWRFKLKLAGAYDWLDYLKSFLLKKC